MSSVASTPRDVWRKHGNRGRALEGYSVNGMGVVDSSVTGIHHGRGLPHVYPGPLMKRAAARAFASAAALWRTLAGT
jgi:hypothetical protein